MLSSFAKGQDLYNDEIRLATGPYFGDAQAAQTIEFNTTNTPYFRPGLIESETQPILYCSLAPVVTNATTGAMDWDVCGTQLTGFQSNLFWNFHPTSFTLPTGYVLPASSVTLDSVDRIPAVEIDLAKASPAISHTVKTVATPIGGSTPGNLVLMSLSNGTWTTLFTDSLTAAKSDTRTISVTANTRLRWMLVRSGSKAAEATLSVVVD